MNKIDYTNNELFTKFKNFNEFPLRVSLFRRYPTSLQLNELPEVFRGSYLMNDNWRSKGYGGVDGIMLTNIAKTLNFTPVIVEPIGIDFGFRATNGTYLGNFYCKQMQPICWFTASNLKLIAKQEQLVKYFIVKHMLHLMDVS